MTEAGRASRRSGGTDHDPAPVTGRRGGVAHAAARLVRLWRDRTRRGIMLATVSIPGNLVMAGWKAWLFLADPSLLLLANIGFNLGVAVAKGFAVRRHRVSVGSDDRAGVQRRGYRWIGAAIAVMATAYVLCCLPSLTSTARATPYSEDTAMMIAVLTFAEFGVAIWGAVTARRDREHLIEAVKLVNLASALVLMVLTESALLSATNSDDDRALYTGYTGVFLGGVVLLLGLAMVLRPFRAERRQALPATPPR